MLDRGALDNVRETLKDAAGIAAETARLLAPGRTGALAESYRAFTRGNVAGVRSPLPYAGVIEYGGTISPRGVPILIQRQAPITRAIERERDAIVERLGDGIEEAARRAGFH